MEKIVAKVEHKTIGKKANKTGLIISIAIILLGFCFSDDMFEEWYYLRLYSYYWHEVWYDVISLMFVCLFLPQIIIILKRFICDAQAMMTSLYIDKDKIYGSFGNFTKKEMVIPIEQLDNVIVTNSLADNIRSGKTIVLSSASGKIKFHFIQNAEEITSTILKMINEYKNNHSSISKTVVTNNAPQMSKTDEIKKYKELLNEGIITQEEFETKKKQILGL